MLYLVDTIKKWFGYGVWYSRCLINGLVSFTSFNPICILNGKLFLKRSTIEAFGQA